MDPNFIFAHWWQLILVSLALGFVLWLVGKSLTENLEVLGKILSTLIKELSGKTKSPGGALVNILMIICAFVIAVMLASPSILVQLGLINEVDYISLFVGVILFLFVAGGSAWILYRLEVELSAFQEDQDAD